MLPGREIGKEIRWRRLFHTADGRLLTLAVDHGAAYKFDLPDGLRDIARTLRKFHTTLPDAIVAQVGLFSSDAMRSFAGRVPLMLQTISITPSAPDDSYPVSTVEDAVTLGADAAAVAISVGGATQARSMSLVGEVVRRARPLGMPVVAHVYPLGEAFHGAEYAPHAVSYCARAGFEAGADLVKVHYTGDPDSFARIVEETPIGLVAAGGPKLSSVRAVLEMARDVARSGACGLTIGRNLWGDPHPAALLQALLAVFHEGAPVADGEKIYSSGVSKG